LAVAIIGAALAGIGNGLEAVAARTLLQEHVEQSWMAMIMSLNESVFSAMPGAGILLGGGIAALAGTRVSLAVAGVGALGVALAAWTVLRVTAGGGLPGEDGAQPAAATEPAGPASRAPEKVG